MLDKNLRQFATDRQWVILETIDKEGSNRKAAKKLGLALGTVGNLKAAVLRKAAKQGYSPEHGLTNTIPDGYKLKGASTLYNKRTGESVLQWIKTSEDQARQEIFFRETVNALSESLPRFEPVAPPEQNLENLAVVYPVGDAHIGMLSWGDETGEDYDIEIGERLLNGAIDYLVKESPNSERSLIAILGDFLHYDSFDAVTPAHKNLLDADGRYPKMVRASIRIVRNMVNKALTHHKEVNVIIEIGNHDPSSSVFLTECLYNVYENEPRVIIDRSPSRFHYFRHGKCLIGTHHGDKVKPQDLPLIMATDRFKDWGETEYRKWLTGHRHTKSKFEFPGCTVEGFGILPPPDAFAAASKWRSLRDMEAIVLHKNFGEVGRKIFNPKMLIN